MLVERWRRESNTIRPHGALGYRPPAPEAVWLPPTSAAAPVGGSLRPRWKPVRQLGAGQFSLSPGGHRAALVASCNREAGRTPQHQTRWREAIWGPTPRLQFRGEEAAITSEPLPGSGQGTDRDPTGARRRSAWQPPGAQHGCPEQDRQHQECERRHRPGAAAASNPARRSLAYKKMKRYGIE